MKFPSIFIKGEKSLRNYVCSFLSLAIIDDDLSFLPFPRDPGLDSVSELKSSWPVKWGNMTFSSLKNFISVIAAFIGVEHLLCKESRKVCVVASNKNALMDFLWEHQYKQNDA